MIKKIDLKYLLFVFVFYSLIFQNFLQQYIKVYRYFDEVLALMYIGIAFCEFMNNIVRKKTIKYDKSNLIISLSLMILILSGLYSNYKLKLQPLKIVLSDLLLTMKFFLIFFGSKKILTINFIEDNKKNILFHINLIVTFLLLMTIGNYIFDWFPSEIRYGINSNKLFFEHPTYLVSVCVFLLSIYILLSKKVISKISFSLLLIIFTTLRFKAISFILISLLLLLYINKSSKKISISKMAVLAFVAIIVSYKQIIYYFFSNDGFARTALLKQSLNIASDHFPFGVGFGTFGSYYSTVSYSSVYAKYGISHVYGLENGRSFFAMDTFWPMIIGQFGVIGVLCFIFAIYGVFKYIQDSYDYNDKYVYLGKMLCFCYLIISSIAESSFVSPVAIPLALVIGINYKSNNKEEL